MAITYSSPNLKVVGGHDNGTATGGSTTSLTDSSKSWTTNQWRGKVAYFISGAGAVQAARIISNTATVLTFDVALDVAVASGTTYLIQYSIADVKAANDSGGWGQVAQNQDTFTIAQNLVIGDRISYSGLDTVGKNITFSNAKPGFAILDKGIYVAGLVKDGIGYNGTRLRMPNAPSTAGAGKQYTVSNFTATFDIVVESTAVVLFNGSGIFKDFTFYNTRNSSLTEKYGPFEWQTTALANLPKFSVPKNYPALPADRGNHTAAHAQILNIIVTWGECGYRMQFWQVKPLDQALIPYHHMPFTDRDVTSRTQYLPFDPTAGCMQGNFVF